MSLICKVLHVWATTVRIVISSVQGVFNLPRYSGNQRLGGTGKVEQEAECIVQAYNHCLFSLLPFLVLTLS